MSEATAAKVRDYSVAKRWTNIPPLEAPTA